MPIGYGCAWLKAAVIPRGCLLKSFPLSVSFFLSVDMLGKDILQVVLVLEDEDSACCVPFVDLQTKGKVGLCDLLEIFRLLRLLMT